MNQSKLKYARERLEVMENAAIADVKRANPKKREFTRQDAIERIESGEAQFNWRAVLEAVPDGRYSINAAFTDALDAIIENDNMQIEIANKLIHTNIEAEIDKIKAKRIAVEDELVLGDETKALALLAEFNAQYSGE